MKKFEYKGIGIKDSEFLRDKAPMTKQEVRVLSLAKLGVAKDDICIDIGAGTGSVSIELGFLSKKVFAVETNENAVETVCDNIEKFGLDNIEVIHGVAPMDIKDIGHVDKVFVGGSKGNLEEIFEWLSGIGKIRVVCNFIVLENAAKCIELFRRYGYDDIDVCQVMISKGKSVGDMTMMIANNPVYIISGEKLWGSKKF